jgi:hypothetical protein
MADKQLTNPGKRTAKTMEGSSENSEGATKVQKTSEGCVKSNIDENTSLAKLTVGDLNVIMWNNFKAMHAQTV